MDDLIDNDNEDVLELATKTWKKVINTASQTGYSEGKSDGSLSVFQNGFDQGYKEAFQPTFILGVFKGLSKFLMENSEHPKEIQEILADTKRGICYLCHSQLLETKTFSERSISEIQGCQKEHSEKILKILLDYFEPQLKEKQIDFRLNNFVTR